jgi:hypothetical protein
MSTNAASVVRFSDRGLDAYATDFDIDGFLERHDLTQTRASQELKLGATIIAQWKRKGKIPLAVYQAFLATYGDLGEEARRYEGEMRVWENPVPFPLDQAVFDAAHRYNLARPDAQFQRVDGTFLTLRADYPQQVQTKRLTPGTTAAFELLEPVAPVAPVAPVRPATVATATPAAPAPPKRGTRSVPDTGRRRVGRPRKHPLPERPVRAATGTPVPTPVPTMMVPVAVADETPYATERAPARAAAPVPLPPTVVSTPAGPMLVSFEMPSPGVTLSAQEADVIFNVMARLQLERNELRRSAGRWESEVTQLKADLEGWRTRAQTAEQGRGALEAQLKGYEEQLEALTRPGTTTAAALTAPPAPPSAQVVERVRKTMEERAVPALATELADIPFTTGHRA